MIDVYKKTYASDGVVGLYRGFWVSCANIVMYRGWVGARRAQHAAAACTSARHRHASPRRSCYFGFYDTVKELLPKDTQKSFTASFFLGWSITIAAGLASYPLDTVRRRMMMKSGESVKYRSSWDCLLQIVRNEGSAALFKGAGANILRGVTGTGAARARAGASHRACVAALNSVIRPAQVPACFRALTSSRLLTSTGASTERALSRPASVPACRLGWVDFFQKNCATVRWPPNSGRNAALPRVVLSVCTPNDYFLVL